MSSPYHCCYANGAFNQHSPGCNVTTAKARAELGAPSSGVWWIGTPNIPKDQR